MDVQQTSSVLDDMSTALVNEDQMVNNAMMVLPIELTNAIGTHLQDLNEDCLLEIFSCNSLTLMDLCSLAETCKLFKQITQRLFSKGFDIKREHPVGEPMYTFFSKGHSQLTTCTFQDMERILKNFGSHLSELQVDRNLTLVDVAAQYCGDITLKRLEIFYLTSTEGVTQQLNSIFQRLLHLSLYECNLRIATWNMNFDSLIELEIVNSTTGAALLRNTFPILERFRFVSDDVSSGRKNSEAMSEFFKRHGCLKSVELYGVRYGFYKLLNAINYNCNELVELTLGNLGLDFFNIFHFPSLAKLEVLNIGFGKNAALDSGQRLLRPSLQLQPFKSLNTMKIWFDDYEWRKVPNQFFGVLSQLQGLRELHMEYCDLERIPWIRMTQLRKVYLSGTIRSSYDSYLLDVITALINLEQLQFECDFVDDFFDDTKWQLTEQGFNEIVKIVEGRAHVLTLECHCDFAYEENCNEKRNVKLVQLPY